jgi:phenylacetate-CoA ligase
VVHSPEQVGFASAARLRQLAWHGLGTAEQPTANIWAKNSAKDPALSRSDGEAVGFRINHWALTARTLPAVHAEIVEAGGVRLVGGTTSMLEHWAGLYEDSGLSGAELGVRLAIVGGEMTYPEQRARIERGFGCPTALMYGSWEAPMIACECPGGSLHVNEEVVLVEVVLPDGTAAAPGEFGSVAVTLLHNPQFPLIRYLLGDSASWCEGACECGLPHRTLAVDVGRREDLISCRDGRRLHPRVIRSTLERELGAELRAFHSIQEAPGRFEVGITAEDPPTRRLQELIAEELRTCMGEPVTVMIREIDEAEVGRLRGGKLRTFTNRIEDG